MEKIIYALGFFDGVHIGHGALLSACRELAGRFGCRAGVVTFGTHPDIRVLGQTPALLSTVQERERLLKTEFHMDAVVTLPFDEKMQKCPWRDFLEMLQKDFNAAGFVCGDDFRFGHKGQGRPELLAQYCREKGLPWAVVPEQTLDGIRVSSTHIRRLIEQGEMEQAVRFLGHPHTVTGTAFQTQEDLPAVGMNLPEGTVVPGFGIYAAQLRIKGRTIPAPVGISPAESNAAAMAEILLPKEAGDLLGEELTLALYTRISAGSREEKDLLGQVQRYLQTTLT